MPDTAARESTRLPSRPAPAEPSPPAAQRAAIPAPEPPLRIPPVLLEGDHAPPLPVSGPGAPFVTAFMPVLKSEAQAEGPQELPPAYGTQRLFLMARDPRTLYAEWDLSDEQVQTYRAAAADGHLSLRLFQTEAGSGPIEVVALKPVGRHGFIHAGKAGAAYLAQLGFRDKDGCWQVVSTSERVMTPPETPARSEATQPAEEPELPGPSTSVPPPAGGPGQIRLRVATSEPAVVSAHQQAPEVRPVPILDYGEETMRTPAAEASARVSATQAPAVVGATPLLVPELRPAPSLRVGLEAVPPSAPTAPALPAELNLSPAVRQELERLIYGHFVKPVVTPDHPAWPGAEPVARPEVQGPALAPTSPTAAPGAPVAIFSPMGGAVPPEDGRGFWLTVNAEVVVFGATIPGAKVTVDDRPIPLRPDGTFSLRFALPDGEYQLPIVAVSPAEDDARVASLRLARLTTTLGDVGAHAPDPGLRPPDPA